MYANRNNFETGSFQIVITIKREAGQNAFLAENFTTKKFEESVPEAACLRSVFQTEIQKTSL